MEKVQITPQDIVMLLKNKRILIDSEKKVQCALQAIFKENGIEHYREHYFDRYNIIDFLLPGGIGIEVKINGGKRAIYEQLVRYCSFKELEHLLLVTNKSIGLPPRINGVSNYIINLSKAWL